MTLVPDYKVAPMTCRDQAWTWLALFRIAVKTRDLIGNIDRSDFEA
jgi:hypothetical protein